MILKKCKEEIRHFYIYLKFYFYTFVYPNKKKFGNCYDNLSFINNLLRIQIKMQFLLHFTYYLYMITLKTYVIYVYSELWVTNFFFLNKTKQTFGFAITAKCHYSGTNISEQSSSINVFRSLEHFPWGKSMYLGIYPFSPFPNTSSQGIAFNVFTYSARYFFQILIPLLIV